MNNLMVKIILSLLMVSSLLDAGKNTVPVEAPVVPVALVSPVPLYIGVGLLWAGNSRNCECANTENNRLKDSSFGGILRVGYDFNPYVGIESRILKASIDSDMAETTHYGIFLKPQYHITDALSVYGLIGYGHTEVKCTAANVLSPTYEKDGLSLGIGLEYDVSSDKSEGDYMRSFDGQGDQEKGLGVWVDYQNLLHDEGSSKIKANVVSAGVTYDF